MNKREARQAIKLLEANGCRDGEMTAYLDHNHAHWRVYATDNATGYRFHADSLESVREGVRVRAWYLSNATGQS